MPCPAAESVLEQSMLPRTHQQDRDSHFGLDLRIEHVVSLILDSQFLPSPSAPSFLCPSVCAPSLPPQPASFLLCSLSEQLFISWLPIFLLIRYSLAARLFSQRPCLGLAMHTHQLEWFCLRCTCWLLSVVNATWRIKLYQENWIPFCVSVMILCLGPSGTQSETLKSSCLLEILRIWKGVNFKSSWEIQVANISGKELLQVVVKIGMV